MYVLGYVPKAEYDELKTKFDTLNQRPQHPALAIVQAVASALGGEQHKIIKLHREEWFEIAYCEHCDKNAFGVCLDKNHLVNDAFKIIIEAMPEVTHCENQEDRTLMVNYQDGTDAKQLAKKVAEKTKSFYA